jgi:CheY-like chemotaxis protein
MIKITDNGIGIEKENIKKIFETFFTTKDKKGTGLGLSTVKDIVNSYNGNIEVKSEYSIGTSFKILIPSIKQIVYEPRKYIKKEFEPSIKGNVLLIDDEEVIREIGKDMLNSLKINCLTARDGEEGIEVYKKNRDKIDIIILDIELPGISGEKVFDILKQINPDIKILIASGYGKDYLEKKVFQKKIKNFMAKPFQLNQLSKNLNELMKE